MAYTAIKTFQIEEETTEDTRCRIRVKFRGVVIDEFVGPTMTEAVRDFENAGYQRSSR